MTLFLIFETQTNGFLYFILSFFTLISVGFAIFTINSKNPIVSVICLIFLFSSVSLYLISIGLHFIGLSYLLVYVGAVSILFLFILMLISIRTSELTSPTSNSIALGISIIIALYYTLDNIMIKNSNLKDIIFLNLDFSKKKNSDIYFVSSKGWDSNLAASTDISSIGNIMYSSYSIWLLLTSFILLLSMLGSILTTIEQ